MKPPATSVVPAMLYTGVVALAVGLLVALVLSAIVLLLSSGARAAAAEPLLLESPHEAGAGQLLLERGDGYLPAPVLQTDVRIDVAGMLARARVTQTFANPGEDWQEGVYVFPLPDDAAVDRLRLTVGERVIEGRIRERAAARRQYEQAVRAGKRASLLEQERPNIFTISVANIGPGETVTVAIEYQQTVGYVERRFELRFPLVVGPRYMPGRARVGGFEGTGWAADTDPVADASRISPPVARPDGMLRNPVNIVVELAAGMPLDALDSAYHDVEVESTAPDRYRVSLRQGPVPADRDFLLSWRPAAGAAPQAALFTDDGHAAGRHSLLMLVPPSAGEVAAARLARELIFVVDTSGSMGGASIRQARRALRLALDRLRPEDAFNVIQFNSVTDALFPAPVAAAPGRLQEARRYVDGLRASGGTEMAPAVSLALRQPDAGAEVRQLVFLTDGAIGNEQELFGIIERNLADRRLFTIGIGSAPNGYFMRRAARFGRGSHTFIGKIGEVEARMSALFARLEQPLMRDIEIHLPAGAEVEMWPARVPDLYAGEPLLLALRGRLDTLRVSGRLTGKAWEAELTLDGGRRNPAVPALWARRKIAALMDQRVHGNDAEAIRRQVLDTALAYHLVSRYTSLVAIDVTPARVRERLLRERAIATNLPHGWDYDQVFGALPGTATSAAPWLLAGALALSAALLLRLQCRKRCA